MKFVESSLSVLITFEKENNYPPIFGTNHFIWIKLGYTWNFTFLGECPLPYNMVNNSNSRSTIIIAECVGWKVLLDSETVCLCDIAQTDYIYQFSKV